MSSGRAGPPRRRPYIPPPKAIAAVNRRLAALPAGLRAHVERARATSIEIARALGADQPRVDFALAAHDVYRAATDSELLAEARRRGLQPSEFESAEPLMLHGPLAGCWLSIECGVTDRAVLEAVAFHTTFAPRLGRVEAAVFLADKIEPGKLGRAPWLAEVLDLALAGRAAEAIVRYLTCITGELRENGSAPHPMADAAVAWLRSGGEI